MSSDKRKAVQAKRRSSNRSTDYLKIVGIVLILTAITIAIVIGIYIKNMKKEQQPVAPAVSSGEQNDSLPAMTVDVSKTYLATVTLEKGGEFVIELYPDKAPVTVNNFVFLANKGYFDSVTFHRVLEGFMAQTGDPTGTGSGGPGYIFDNEENDLSFDKEGVVAMANSGVNTNGSQFFITYAPTAWLDGDYTIFGQVTSGMDVVRSLTLRDPQQNPNFTGDVIESITITEQ